MATINTYTIHRDKIGKGYFYLFKYSDYESVLSGITEQPLYLSLFYAMRPIIKTDTAQLKGEWSLVACHSDTELPYQFPDPKAKLIYLSTSSLPHQLFVGEQIDRQVVKQICIDHLRPFFEQALKLDRSLIAIKLLLKSKTISIQTELGSQTNQTSISLEST